MIRLRLRHKIGLVLVVLGATFGLGRCKRTAANGPKLSAPAVLPDGDSEQLIVDPMKHTVTIVKSTGNQTLFLPDHPSTIDILKNGTINVTFLQYGWEHVPFIGAGYSDKLRYGVGLDGAYWKHLDLGVGVETDSGFKDTRVFVGLSYTVKDNLRLTLTFDHKQTIGALMSLRI